MKSMTPYKPKDKNVYRVKISYEGKTKTLSLHRHKAVSVNICRNIEALISCKKANMPLDPTLTKFIEGLDTRIASKLEEWGIIRQNQYNNMSLSILLERYGDMLVGKNLTIARVKDAKSIVHRFYEWCNYHYPSDIMSDGVRAYLKYIVDSGKSARTHNKHLQGIKQFVNWLSIIQLSHTDLRGILPLNERVDKRLERRALSEKEEEQLLDSLTDTHHGLTPQERELVYLFALDAGLRWKEIVTLLVSDINLLSNSLTIHPKNEKARRGAILLLSSRLHEALEQYLTVARLPLCQLFERIWKDKATRMLKRDLKAAGIPFNTDEGQADSCAQAYFWYQTGTIWGHSTDPYDINAP